MKKVEVDDELYEIIMAMRASPMTNRAIRAYARAFIAPKPKTREEWTDEYRKKY